MKVTINISSDAIYATLVALDEYRDKFTKEHNVEKKWIDAADEAYRELAAFNKESCHCCDDCRHYIGKNEYRGYSCCNKKRVIVDSFKNDCEEFEKA